MNINKNFLLSFYLILLFIQSSALLYIFYNYHAISVPNSHSFKSATSIITTTPTPSVVIQKEPSERAMRAVIYIMVNGSDQDKKSILDKYSQKTNDTPISVRNMAFELDQNLQFLLALESYIDQLKTQASKAVINNDVPDAYAQPKQQLPINCTSNKVGNYTYTNCY